MVHKEYSVIRILEYRQTIVDQMWDDTFYLSLHLSSVYKDGQHVCHYVKKDRRQRISLSQSFLCLKILSYLIIYFNAHVSSSHE